MTPIPRVGGRLILLDPDDRVLLINERIDGGRTHWLTPGGGVEPGEDPRQAAIREVHEEIGARVVLASDAPEVHTQRRAWSWAGLDYDQLDHFFLAHVPRELAIMPAAPTEMERQTLIGHRWWSAAELRATTERVEPPELAEVIDRFARAQPRTSGRVLLLDPSGRILLLRHRLDLGSDATHWITPGGGVEPGESPAAAAVRELAEETGLHLSLPPGARAEHVDRETFSFGGRRYAQTNHYFVLAAPTGAEVDARGHDESEREVLLEARWWTPEQLRMTGDAVRPSDLADILARVAPGPA